MTRNPDRTRRSIEVHVVAERTDAGRYADETLVAAIMTPRVVCVTEDLGVDSLTLLLDEKGFGGVPVLDRSGALIGMVSKTDIVRMARENDSTQATPTIGLRDGDRDEPGRHPIDSETRTVADIMMPLAFSIFAGATVGQASAMMAVEGVHRLPVTDGSGNIVGILSATDVVRWVAASAGYLGPTS